MLVKNYCLLILIVSFFYSFSIHAQKKMIHGKVITFKNITVENAQISVRKTKNLVYSDSLGCFSIECNLKDKISISAAGFKTQQVKVKTIKDSLNVTLTLTGSEEDIDLAMKSGHIDEEDRDLVKKYYKSNEIYSLGYTNMTNLIQGKFPRVSIINNELIIRGIKTHSENHRKGALIIINGTEYNWSSVKNMIVTNIKSIRILNSLEASRYGTGAGNGVVVIKLVDE